jgi:hypothetical protein
MIHFRCPYCGNAIVVEDTDAGKAGNCHGCGKRITVPRPVIVRKDETDKTRDMPDDGPAAEPPS